MANIFTPLAEDKKAKSLMGFSPVVLNVSKKILARESIFRNIDCNITHDLKRGISFLTEDQIKMSSIYQRLLQRIQKAKCKQQQEVREHEKVMQRMDNDIKYLKRSVQEDKVEMWEAKNQIMELQELLDQQMEQYNAICEEMREEEEFQRGEGQDQGEFQDNNNENGTSQNNEGSYRVETQKSQKQLSKPSCSIKNFMSNRTITSPDFSKENLQIGSGVNFDSKKDATENHQQLLSAQSQKQPSSQHRMLSFKKSEKLVCLEN